MFNYYSDNLGSIYAVCESGYIQMMPMSRKGTTSIELTNYVGRESFDMTGMTTITVSDFFEKRNTMLYKHDLLVESLNNEEKNL
jgi:hypothetical protein